MASARIIEAIRSFLDDWLTEDQRQILAASRYADFRLGRYRGYSGGAVRVAAERELTPNFALRVSGDALPLVGGLPNPLGVEIGDHTTTRPLVWIRRLADPLEDDEETIRGVLRNAAYHLQVGGTARDMGEDYARALAHEVVALAPSGTLGANLFSHAQVPEGLSLFGEGGLEELHEVMGTYFTYGWNGDYYPRWRPGADRTDPAHFSDEYLDRSLLELQLRDGGVYVYLLVPSHFLTGELSDGTGRSYREVVLSLEFDRDSETVTSVQVVHTVDAPPGVSMIEDFYDIVFFEAEEGFQPQHVRELRPVTTYMHGIVVGHASPRWDHPDPGETRESENLELSRQRSAEVRQRIQDLFTALEEREALGEIDGLTFELVEACYVPRVSTGDEAEGTAVIGIGDDVTIIEAGGDTSVDDASMRRANIEIQVTHEIALQQTLEYTDVVSRHVPGVCQPNATDRWAVKLALSGGAGHAGLGGVFALGELKNRLTHQRADGSFQGGGPGLGASTPGADPGWGDWVDFRADAAYTFEDFDGTLARLTTVGAGFLIGYTKAYLSFPMMGANSISVGGWNLGAVGADASTNVGTWNVIGNPPGPRCSPDRVEEDEVTRRVEVPFRYEDGETLTHTVHFDTGSAELSDPELAALQEFVERIRAAYHAQDELVPE